MNARNTKIKLTKEFQNVLGEIFNQADLDGSGTLSRWIYLTIRFLIL